MVVRVSCGGGEDAVRPTSFGHTFLRIVSAVRVGMKLVS